MSIRKIKTFPENILRARCKKVQEVDEQVRKILNDMVITMHFGNGIGLAAPQVGLDMSLIVVDIGEDVIKLINPTIIKSEGTSVLEEGCLSLPDITVNVKRAASITVVGLNEQGQERTIEAKSLLAHVLQHEIDHIHGKLLIDYLPFYKRVFAIARLKKH